MKLPTFGNLFLLFISHPPHSLAKHALHKRTGLDSLSAPSGATFPLHAVHRDPTTPPIQHQQPPTQADHALFSQGHLPLAAPHHAPEAQSLVLWNHEPDHELLYDRAIASLPSSRRFYSYPSYLEGMFKGLPSSDSITEDLINTIVGKIPREHIIGTKQEGNIDPVLIKRTENTLHDVMTFLTDKLPDANKQLAVASQSIAEELDNIAPSPASQLVGISTSRYNTSKLLNEQHIISKVLGRLSSLSKLHGILGPDDLFSHELQVLLENSRDSGQLPSHFKPDEFIQKLKGLPVAFSSILGIANHFPKREPSPNRNAFEEFNKFNNEFQRNYFGLGSRVEFERLITCIEKSDVYRSTRREYMQPQDLAGYELALMQPFGIAREMKDVSLDDFSDKGLSIVGCMSILKTLESVSRIAAANTRLRTSIASEASRLVGELEKDFSADGLITLTTHLKEASTKPIALVPLS